MAGDVSLLPPLNHPFFEELPSKTSPGRLSLPWAMFFTRVQTANNGNAPVDAEYVVGAADAVLTNERVATNSTSNTWNLATIGQATVERAALTGDVTASANSNVTTIADDAVTFAKMQEIATQRVIGRNTAGAGNPEEVSAAQVLDWLGSTRGAVLYRGAAGWAILGPGTSGDALTSNGAGADPSYQSVAADIQALLDSLSTTQGAVLYRDASDWVALSPGTDGQVLQTQGGAANPQWQDVNLIGFWSPLTNGDAASPELIFDGNGDTVDVWTAL